MTVAASPAWVRAVFVSRAGAEVWKRTSAVVTTGALALAALSGCASVEVSPPITSCHDYNQNSAYGHFSIQQAAKNAAIAWGAYPNAAYSGTVYKVNVYANGVKIDGKNQNYAPHGSVGADKAAKYTGKILAISGTVTNGGETVLVFNMQCRIM